VYLVDACRIPNLCHHATNEVWWGEKNHLIDELLLSAQPNQRRREGIGLRDWLLFERPRHQLRSAQLHCIAGRDEVCDDRDGSEWRFSASWVRGHSSARLLKKNMFKHWVLVEDVDDVFLDKGFTPV
jgi:hypothetical protein